MDLPATNKTADPVDAHVGRSVRAMRIKTGLSQESVAEVLGVSYQQIQKYERAVKSHRAVAAAGACHPVRLRRGGFLPAASLESQTRGQEQKTGRDRRSEGAFLRQVRP